MLMKSEDLYKELTNEESLKDIPLAYITKVAFELLKILNKHGIIIF